MKTATATENRARLLSIAAGHDGHIEDWIECVHIDGAAPEQQTGYIYHNPARVLPNGKTTAREEFWGTLEHCRKMYMLPYLGDDDAPDINSIPVEDMGRHIPADVWQKRYETHITYEKP